MNYCFSSELPAKKLNFLRDTGCRSVCWEREGVQTLVILHLPVSNHCSISYMFHSIQYFLLHRTTLLCMRVCVCTWAHKGQDKTMFSRTFIITFQSSQDLPQFLNTVENWFLNPSTAHKICAVKILKEPLLGLSGRKITQTHWKCVHKKLLHVAPTFAIYMMELDNRESKDLPSCFLRK